MTLLAFVACLFPIAIPRFQLKNSSTPFPCQTCACGCQTPEQCWTHCCCFTPKQRAVWAQKNGVTPPSYAILDENANPSASVVKARKSCCEQKVTNCSECVLKESTCDTNSAKTSLHRNCTLCTVKKEKPQNNSLGTKSRSKSSGYLLVMLAFKCKGLTLGFTLLPVFDLALPISAPMFPSFVEFLTTANIFEVRAYYPVPSPPPKL